MNVSADIQGEAFAEFVLCLDFCFALSGVYVFLWVYLATGTGIFSV